MEERLGDFRFHQRFASKHLGNHRTIAVYLPPGYFRSRGQRFPVLYLHDGQNLFDASTAAFGVEWGAHVAAERLIAQERIRPLILVGIYNTPDRIDEYTPYRDPVRKVGGKGGLYARFLVDELKPFIDHHYRTLPGRLHTAVAGSSLGGLISLGISCSHSNVFSMCGSLSPSLWWMEDLFFEEFDRDPDWPRGVRFWVDMGTNESPGDEESLAGVERCRNLCERFERAGLQPDVDFHYLEVPGGGHNEAAWAARFDRVLQFFFGR